MERDRTPFRVIEGGRSTEPSKFRDIANDMDAQIEQIVEATSFGLGADKRGPEAQLSQLLGDAKSGEDAIEKLKFLFYHCYDSQNTFSRERIRDGVEEPTPAEDVRESAYALLAYRIARTLTQDLGYDASDDPHIASCKPASHKKKSS